MRIWIVLCVPHFSSGSEDREMAWELPTAFTTREAAEIAAAAEIVRVQAQESWFENQDITIELRSFEVYGSTI